MNCKDKQEKLKKNKKKKRPFEYFFYDFVKVTGAIPAFVIVRPKFIYENENAKKPLSFLSSGL